MMKINIVNYFHNIVQNRLIIYTFLDPVVQNFHTFGNTCLNYSQKLAQAIVKQCLLLKEKYLHREKSVNLLKKIPTIQFKSKNSTDAR